MLYIAPKGISSGIFHSQIYMPALALVKNGQKTAIAVHVNDRENYSNINGVQNIYYNKHVELKHLFKEFKKIYVREFYDFFSIYFLVKLFTKSKIHYSFRGAVFIESFYRNKNYLNMIVLYLAEFIVYHLADELSCVSKQMKEYLHKSFFAKRDITVQYCGITSVYLKSKYQHSLHFVYLGGLSKWQKVDEALNIYKFIHKNIKKEIRFSLVTQDLDNAEKLVIKKDQKKYNINILALKPEKVPAFLQTCDFGFLLRENSTVNKISSPVKFLEYTANGVIPIISAHVGDYSEDVTKNNIGICLKSNDTLDQKLIININHFIGDNSVFQRLYSYSKKFIWEILILAR
tara:strand:- start:517 stop:1554 length:1038 start_codon:yes stop_codon:yes gene_type:complete